MKAQVNELLLYARFPFHFYTEVAGGRPLWDNPGKAILSLCAFNLSQNVVNLKEADVTVFNECMAFTQNSENSLAACDWLQEQVKVLIDRAAHTEAATADVVKLTVAVNQLGTAFASLGAISLAGTLNPGDSSVIAFHQGLIDAKQLVENIEANLPEQPSAS
jgi:hypothetical protein